MSRESLAVRTLAANNNERSVNICPYIFNLLLEPWLEYVRAHIGHEIVVLPLVYDFPDESVYFAARQTTLIIFLSSLLEASVTRLASIHLLRKSNVSSLSDSKKNLLKSLRSNFALTVFTNSKNSK